VPAAENRVDHRRPTQNAIRNAATTTARPQTTRTAT
jgi:hypothetical protein